MPKGADPLEGQSLEGHTSGDEDRAALIEALTRIISEWSAPEFLTGVVAREGVELDPGAIKMVTMLAAQGPQRPSQLARNMVTGASNISKIAQRLTTTGLAARISDPNDARAHQLALTESGHHVSSAFVRAGNGMVDDLLQGWSGQERQELLRSMQKLEHATMAFAAQLHHTAATGQAPVRTTAETEEGVQK